MIEKPTIVSVLRSIPNLKWQRAILMEGERKHTRIVPSLGLSKARGILLRVIQYSCEVGVDAELEPKCGQIHPASSALLASST